MRSSKSRSRSKNNRNNNNTNRSGVNIVNRVFDSSGPEGKVRGTPQQIIDKYNQLTRDAQLGNDRVAAENFQQHAEHYTRLLSEAQREIDARRDQEQQQRDRQQQNNGQNNNQNNNGQNNNSQNITQQPQVQQDDRAEAQAPAGEMLPKADGPAPKTRAPRRRKEAARPAADQGNESAHSTDVIDSGDEADSGLVETPENAVPKPRRTRKPRVKPDETASTGEASGSSDNGEVAVSSDNGAPEAAE